MPREVKHTSSPEETEAVGAALGRALTPGEVVLVSGELGSGKTTFVRGACRALGVEGPVTSPTFTIGQVLGSDPEVAHLDLYRLGSLAGEDPALLDDFLTPERVGFVEWPELAEPALERVAARVLLEHAGGDRRRVAEARERADAGRGVRDGDGRGALGGPRGDRGGSGAGHVHGAPDRDRDGAGAGQRKRAPAPGGVLAGRARRRHPRERRRRSRAPPHRCPPRRGLRGAVRRRGGGLAALRGSAGDACHTPARRRFQAAGSGRRVVTISGDARGGRHPGRARRLRGPRGACAPHLPPGPGGAGRAARSGAPRVSERAGREAAPVNPELEIRPLAYADLPQVIAIERRAFPTPWSLAMFVLELSKPSGICLAALEDGVLVGYLVCSRYDTVWHLMNVAVDPVRQRHGIASALLVRLFEQADKPSEQYTLEVRTSNDAAIRLYERFGFRPAGRRRAYYHDNREDALIMWRKVEQRTTA